MGAPKNNFKAALKANELQIGLWMGLANATTAEICAGAGFDWLVVDGEHGPNHIQSLLEQLRAVASHPSSHPVVRAPIGETWILKQLLDIGAQTVLVPMVDSGAQAEELVQAVHYPPNGVRGVGAALARASAFNRTAEYLTTADQQICLLLQVENRAGMAAIEEIAAVDGVDGIFVGPADLAADMGFLGNPGAPEVQVAVDDALKRIVKAGKPAGILTSDQRLAQRYIELGATFVAVGSDVGVLVGGTHSLVTKYKAVTSKSESAGY